MFPQLYCVIFSYRPMNSFCQAAMKCKIQSCLITSGTSSYVLVLNSNGLPRANDGNYSLSCLSEAYFDTIVMMDTL